MAEQQQKIVELELEDAQNKKIILENQLKEREMKARIEKSELYEKIEAKNRELTAKALHLSSRNELMKETLDFLSKIDSINNNTTYNQYLLKLKSQLRNNTEMEDFLTYFEEVNSTFMTSLREKHPDLNANDVRFIAYTYMGLNTKRNCITSQHHHRSLQKEKTTNFHQNAPRRHLFAIQLSFNDIGKMSLFFYLYVPAFRDISLVLICFVYTFANNKSIQKQRKNIRFITN